jgi:hypothetical protein
MVQHARDSSTARGTAVNALQLINASDAFIGALVDCVFVLALVFPDYFLAWFSFLDTFASKAALS